MKCGFKLLIFQNGKLDEELETTQDFADTQQLAQVLINSAALGSAMRLHPHVIQIYTSRGYPNLNLPPAREGYGPTTNVAIKDIAFL